MKYYWYATAADNDIYVCASSNSAADNKLAKLGIHISECYGYITPAIFNNDITFRTATIIY